MLPSRYPSACATLGLRTFGQDHIFPAPPSAYTTFDQRHRIGLRHLWPVPVARATFGQCMASATMASPAKAKATNG